MLTGSVISFNSPKISETSLLMLTTYSYYTTWQLSLTMFMPTKPSEYLLKKLLLETGLITPTILTNLTKDQLMELLKLATTNQLFQLDGILYEQVEGVAMGSPLGPLLANTFMCSIEEKLEERSELPSFYKRYVDVSQSCQTSAKPTLSLINWTPAKRTWTLVWK